MVFFFPGCVFARDAEATGCCTNPVISPIPKWHRPRPIRAAPKCSGQIPISTGQIGTVRDQPQPHPGPTEQGCRIDVVAMAPHREVERSGRHGDHIAAANRGPSTDQQPADEPVGRANPRGMVDADEQPSCDRSGKRDHAVGSRLCHLTDAGVVLDTPVPRTVRTFGEPERVQYRSVGRWGQHHTRRGRRRLRKLREQQPQDENSNE